MAIKSMEAITDYKIVSIDRRDRAFLCTCALLFIASTWGTIAWCGSMADGMPMPGGWTMSMAWMRMADQTWVGAAATFMGMWVLMMVAMMLPSLAPMLARYRRAVGGRDAAHLRSMTALAGAGYFLVWTVVGAAAYPLGIGVAAAEMQWPALARAVPLAAGVVLLLAGYVQLTAWKARHLECCRGALTSGGARSADARGAWKHGLRLGMHCAWCCCGFMVALLVSGVMDLNVMALVATAITVERLVPAAQRAARASGVGLIALGSLVIARAIGIA